MTDGNLPPGCTQDDIDAADSCGGCGVCAECCADEVAAAEAADRAAEAMTLESLIADPATLEAFARYLLDELLYPPDMLCAALGDPAGYGEVFSRWYAERLRLARVRLEEQLEAARELLEGGGAR